MRGAERGFLLLSSMLGDGNRRPLTVSQLRILTTRIQSCHRQVQDRELTADDLISLGYAEAMAFHILRLLADEDVLEHYLQRGKKANCSPITRVSNEYPGSILQKLGLESPGCLWAKGDISLLKRPMIALVGSREIAPENKAFAREVGTQAAKQGFTLVSGNARGADSIAQQACLESGGSVISVVADSLAVKRQQENVLYLSELDFDQEFSAQRAISRNRVIHALGQKTFVAQTDYQTGGTWDGTVKNLNHGWSPVFCMDDGSKASDELQQMGAMGIAVNDLKNIMLLRSEHISLFDQ